ncbi:acyl-coenzyme A thioesterase 1-like isoform X2 [Littorina saxatilis]|uniref:acyl-coenzyme A thioesterase 1-like isoform X2 n=1 Tax=Littorina saxatilis TaxID=31220 RepID=UPI0038B5DBF4
MTAMIKKADKGVDPAGLFWSMRPLPGHPQDARLVIRDVTKPLVVTIAVFSGHVTPDDDTVAMTSPAKPLCVTRVHRRILAPGVKRIEIREGRIRGTLFLPPGRGTHPGVIDMFGAAGGNMETRAALLAGHGFAALSLAFIAFEDLPKRMMDVQFDYFEEATAWLTKHPAVRAGGLGVVGVSSGACNAMLMAIHCPQVKAVVEINGPPFQIVNDFLRQGKVFQRAVVTDINKVEERQKEGFITRDCYVITDEDYFPIWKSDAHILCLVCQDDQQAAWEHAVRVRDLYPQHKGHLIDVVMYPGAGHLLEPPYTPHCRYCYNPVAMGNVLWGGEPKAHAVAQLDAWKRTIDFLHAWLVDTSSSGSDMEQPQ